MVGGAAVWAQAGCVRVAGGGEAGQGSCRQSLRQSAPMPRAPWKQMFMKGCRLFGRWCIGSDYVRKHMASKHMVVQCKVCKRMENVLNPGMSNAWSMRCGCVHMRAVRTHTSSRLCAHALEQGGAAAKAGHLLCT